ncbi:hypothetical protein DOY81_007690, partial [Sarcophaga bullata]
NNLKPRSLLKKHRWKNNLRILRNYRKKYVLLRQYLKMENPRRRLFVPE